MSWSTNRREPYTGTGIARANCIRCGDKAHAQWQICADAGRYRPICRFCDTLLNEMVLKWMGHPDADAAVARYVARQGRGGAEQ